MIINIANDVSSEKDRIARCIEANGNTPEHNYNYFLYSSSEEYAPVFIEFENNTGLFALKGKNTWKVISEPIAPSGKKVELLVEFVEFIFQDGAEKLVLELMEETRQNLISLLPPDYDVKRATYIYNWPVYNLRNFDPELSGSEWKKMRNIKNQFEKNHKIDIVDASSIEKRILMEIFRKWSLSRGGLDSVERDRYVNAIENGFEGMELAKTIVIDGKPCTISGGWRIPNSKGFYPLFGITDYEYKYLGEFATIRELIVLKEKDFEYVNFGGSGKSLLRFKMKFKPDYIYKTIEFSIEKKKAE